MSTIFDPFCFVGRGTPAVRRLTRSQTSSNNRTNFFFRNVLKISVALSSMLLLFHSLIEMEEIINVGKLGGVEVAVAGENVKVEPFAKLQVLELEDLPQLKSICCNPLPFPNLERVRILDCPNIKKLPLNSGSAKERKVVIEAEEHWWRDVEWEDEDTKLAFEPCFRRCFSTIRIYQPPYFFDI